jgi:hypothetical protein
MIQAGSLPYLRPLDIQRYEEERNALKKYVFPRLRDLCSMDACSRQLIAFFFFPLVSTCTYQLH